MRHTILISLIAILALPTWAALPEETPFETGFVTLPAQLVRDGHTTTLLPRKTLEEGDVIKTGDRASVEMHFIRDGVIKLDSNSQLFVHSASPPSLGRGPVLRVQLLRGELTLEAYPASNTIAQDFRLNVGVLQIRALGADVWAFANSEGEAACLHQGAVEITGSAGEQRLDIAGQCVDHRNGGPIQVVAGPEVDLKNRLLIAEKNAVDKVAALEPADDVVKDQPAPAPAPTPAPAPQKSGPAIQHWVVIVASTGNKASAEKVMGQLRRKNLKSTIRETGKPQTPFSVTFGDFPKRSEAEEAAHKLQRKYGLKIVRIAQLS